MLLRNNLENVANLVYVFTGLHNMRHFADLIPFVQFYKGKKHPWRSLTFKPAILLKVTLVHGCFLHFTNGTKLRKASHIIESIAKRCKRSLDLTF